MLPDTFNAIRQEIQKRYTLELQPEHWIGGDDASLSYCRSCALIVIAELEKKNPAEEYWLDGGWRTENDSLPFCERCNAPLESGLTDYGIEQELNEFEENGFNIESQFDWRSLDELMCDGDWVGSPHQDRLAGLCAAVMATIDDGG